jgi:hypothetical protein
MNASFGCSSSDSFKRFPAFIAACALTLFILPGCASSDSGASEVSSSSYYGVGFQDPWYYGGAYYPPDVIVTPPASPVDPPHVEQPIANPSPAPRPLPSIPAAPRPALGR